MKKMLSIILIVVMCLSLVPSVFASETAEATTAEESQNVKMGILYYGNDTKIVALQADIDVFKYAPEGELKEQALQALLTNPNNTVTKIDDSPFVRVGDYSGEDVEGVEAVATSRSPGTWNITPFTIAGGQYTYIKPTGKDAFDIAYNEYFNLVYYCSPDRPISTELSTSVPSVFYDPDWNSGYTIGWYPGVSGQYKLYFKNYSTETANITGGTVKIYSR